MGCRLQRGETIYFVRHGGPTRGAGAIEADWYPEPHLAARLLPRVYTRSDGHSSGKIYPSVVPIEIQSFELS